MTKIMDAKTAADAIRPQLTTGETLSADERYALDFFTKVCSELGLEPNATHIAMIGHLLGKAGIEPYKPQPYPFMLTERDARNRLVPKMWPENHPTKAGMPVEFADAEEYEFYKSNGEKGVNQADLDAWEAVEHPAEPPPAEPAPEQPAA